MKVGEIVWLIARWVLRQLKPKLFYLYDDMKFKHNSGVQFSKFAKDFILKELKPDINIISYYSRFHIFHFLPGDINRNNTSHQNLPKILNELYKILNTTKFSTMYSKCYNTKKVSFNDYKRFNIKHSYNLSKVLVEELTNINIEKETFDIVSDELKNKYNELTNNLSTSFLSFTFDSKYPESADRSLKAKYKKFSQKYKKNSYHNVEFCISSKFNKKKEELNLLKLESAIFHLFFIYKTYLLIEQGTELPRIVSNQEKRARNTSSSSYGY